VEDDEHHRSTVAHHLRKRRFRVIEAEDGVSALKLLKEWPPQIVVTGLGLPDIDGKQLLRLVRAQDGMAQVPVVVLTSADSDENEAELLRLGANDFVSRSRTPEVLIRRIEKTLTRS
jgi:DNA-binding response OmpR family regulator